MLKGVGLYIGRNEVVAVSAIRTRSGPQITSFAIESIGLEGSPQSHPEGGFRGGKRASPEAQAILKVLTTIKERGAFVNVAVSPLQVVTRNFIMPVVPKKDELNAVHNEASRYVPFKITDSMLDYHAYPTHKNVLSVTVTAIRSEILNEYIENLRFASAKVLVVEPVYNATSRVFSALNMIGKVQAHGFVILQSDGNVNVTLASKGVVYLSRDFLLSGRLEDDKARFFSELKASMEYFYKLTGGESIEQIFLSGVGNLKVWVEHLEHAFNYTVRFDVANLPRAKNLPLEALHELLVAFGLALRSLGYRSSLGAIQLLPQAERRSDPPQFMKFVTVEFFLILIFFIIIRFVVFQPYLMSLKNQKEAFIGPAAQEFSTFASRSMEDLLEEKEMLSGKIQLLDGFSNSKMSAVAFLMALGQGLPKSVSLDYVSLEDATGAQASESGKGQKRLNVRGICYLGNAEKETETVGTWLKALGAKKIMAENFGEIRVEEIKREKFRNREVTRFRGVGE